MDARGSDAFAPPEQQEQLDDLRERWRGWRVWRSTNYLGQPGDWCATRLDPAAGPDPTVICDTAADLTAALAEQATSTRPPTRILPT